jgi:hypothetical protein
MLRYNTSTAKIEAYINGAWTDLLSGAAVTSVATGTGLTGGPITSTGTIAIDSTVVTLTGTQTLSNKTIQGGVINSGTPIATVSGTSADFTSIPSWVKRITVMFSGVTTNASTTPTWFVKIGTGTTFDSTGYVSFSFSGASIATSTSGFVFRGVGGVAATNGVFTLSLQSASTNTWVGSGIQDVSTQNQYGAGSKSLSGTLTRVQIVTNGTDTFTAGSVNILYE